MAVPVRQMTPIQAPRRDLIHVTSLASPRKTACGKRCDGWRVAPVSESRVTCQACKEAIFLRVRPRAERAADRRSR